MIGAFIIGAGICCQLIQAYVSIRDRHLTRDLTGDAWGEGRTLEWSIPSPAPFYNFAVIPHVYERDAFWAMKEKNHHNPNIEIQKHYAEVHMPSNTSTGFVIAVFSGLLGFGMTWHIGWMITVGLIGVFAAPIARTFSRSTDYFITSDEMMRMERERAAGQV